MIIADWLASGASLRARRLISKFSYSRWRTVYKNPLASFKQGLVPEEKYQTLLTNEKQGKNC
jgi:hypothetical protein